MSTRDSDNDSVISISRSRWSPREFQNQFPRAIPLPPLSTLLLLISAVKWHELSGWNRSKQIAMRRVTPRHHYARCIITCRLYEAKSTFVRNSRWKTKREDETLAIRSMALTWNLSLLILLPLWLILKFHECMEVPWTLTVYSKIRKYLVSKIFSREVA